MAQLRGEELLRFTQSCKRTEKGEETISAYEILARSGYETRPEKRIEGWSIKSHAVKMFIAEYCQALIAKYGIPEKLEDPFVTAQNSKFIEQYKLPKTILKAVNGLHELTTAFQTGYMSYEDNEVVIDVKQYQKACVYGKQNRVEINKKREEERKIMRAEKAKKPIKDEIDARTAEYREKGVKALPRISETQPSPKSRDIEREVLTGKELILYCMKLANQGVPETSICIRAGYKTDSIGVFRRAFSNAAAVRFGPLSLMLRDFVKSNKDAPKIIAELDAPRSISIEQKPVESVQPKATQEPQAITEERNLVTVTTKQRERDAAFRDAIMKIHGEQCVCCDIAIKDLLEAAHIVPVAFSGSDSIVNGLPLCPTHHSAFDRNLYTFDPDKKTILFKEGMTAADLGITKKILRLNVSQEALKIRLSLFLQP